MNNDTSVIVLQLISAIASIIIIGGILEQIYNEICPLRKNNIFVYKIIKSDGLSLERSVDITGFNNNKEVYDFKVMINLPNSNFVIHSINVVSQRGISDDEFVHNVRSGENIFFKGYVPYNTPLKS